MPDDRPRAPIEHRRVIVKVGTNLLTGGGDALDAELAGRGWVAVGPDGHIYLMDNGNFRIRRIAFVLLP